MGIKNVLVKAAQRTGDGIATMAKLSPAQLQEVQNDREKYLCQLPDPTDMAAKKLTERLLAANSVEIYNAYLSQLKTLYVPVQKYSEYNDVPFSAEYNIRYINITKWVTDKKENSLEKLVNVYQVLSNEQCNIALVFRRTCECTEVYLAVTNTQNENNNVNINSYKERILDSIRGNFPGTEWKNEGTGIIPCFDDKAEYSVASASNIPTEKSEKFISQTIEKLLDGCIPTRRDKEYIIILLATPIQDIEERKLKLAEMYSSLAPYASWTTDFHYQENNSTNSSATAEINVGASVGLQNGQNRSATNSHDETDSTSTSQSEVTGLEETWTENQSTTNSEEIYESICTMNTSSDNVSSSKADGTSNITNKSVTKTKNCEVGATGGVKAGPIKGEVNVRKDHGKSTNRGEVKEKNTTVTQVNSHEESHSTTSMNGHATSNGSSHSTGTTIANSMQKIIGQALTRAVSNAVAKTEGEFQNIGFGANFGANFARSSNVTATVGKNEGITQSYTNYNIKHTLELLENQMKRFEESTALGMWDFAAYVLSEDYNVANNVAHAYTALTQGEESYMSQAAINLWRGDLGEKSNDAKEIYGYLRELRHPIFGLNPHITQMYPDVNVYPPIVTATTSLSGKELAYSLNFPQKSIAGLPVIECAEFGRNIVTYGLQNEVDKKVRIGQIFHMNHKERISVELSRESFVSHTFITGSTGTGKSNAIYQILKEIRNDGIKFLVIEPAKGEYKSVFGMDSDVTVYGTNPEISQMLRINPFSFPKEIHVLEHLDRLIEIFNVCWPMYAAMPAVLKSAVERAYTDCGWNLNTSKNIYDEDIYPTFLDVACSVSKIIDSSDYDNENKGAYKGALKTRLQSLANGINGMMFVQDEVDAADLFDENVIVDLSRIGSSETKSLIMGLLVLKLQEYRMAKVDTINAHLKHITVLEEAHNLLRRSSLEYSSESANLQSKSVEMVANAIAEMRTYGEGFIIADQAPGLLDMSTIRNTNTKIIMRLPDQGDRELVGKAANLNNDQITELAKLPCGVAAVYQNEWVQPVLCAVDKYSGDIKPYTYVINDKEHYENKAVASEALLDCIMNKEILGEDDRTNIKKLKEMIIKSSLDTVVKCDFIEYIMSEKTEGIKALRKLLYDLLEADDAIKNSKECDNLSEWVNSVVKRLNPSIQKYSNRQIDLAMALLIYEQSVRDASYNDILVRFTEIYRNAGGVF